MSNQVREDVKRSDIVVEKIVESDKDADNPDGKEDIVFAFDKFDSFGNRRGFLLHFQEIEFLPIQVIVAFFFEFHQALDFFFVTDPLSFIYHFFLHLLSEFFAKRNLGEVQFGQFVVYISLDGESF